MWWGSLVIEKRIIGNNNRNYSKISVIVSTVHMFQVGENRYTFGTSKTVRMVRQHGQSIVVRVGGGWEYLIKFLEKVDPCRAKELEQNYLNR